MNGVMVPLNDDQFCPPPRFSDKRHVTAMQRTHRGHQRDTGARHFIRLQCTPERRNRPQNLRSFCHNFGLVGGVSQNPNTSSKAARRRLAN